MPPSEPERWFESSNGAAGYADYVPKEEFFRELHNSFLDSRDTFETKCLQQTDGQILSIDASHKVTNLVYVCSSTKVFHGLVTIMNEYSQVVGFWFVKTGALEELEIAMQRDRNRVV